MNSAPLLVLSALALACALAAGLCAVRRVRAHGLPRASLWAEAVMLCSVIDMVVLGGRLLPALAWIVVLLVTGMLMSRRHPGSAFAAAHGLGFVLMAVMWALMIPGAAAVTAPSGHVHGGGFAPVLWAITGALAVAVLAIPLAQVWRRSAASGPRPVAPGAAALGALRLELTHALVMAAGMVAMLAGMLLTTSAHP